MKPRNPARREFIRSVTGASISISSVLVQIKPEFFNTVAEKISALPGTEVQWQAPENNKLIFLLETESDATTLQCIHEVSALKGVITVDLTYNYSGDESNG